MYKVSIIIPVYNVERYLSKCLDSVVNQTLKDIEIICVDDCSTDSSLSILNEYKKRDTRIKVIEQSSNFGSGAARNRALELAQSKYIMYLDSDDWLELNACEVAYNQIHENNNDFAFFNFYYYNEKDNVTKWNKHKYDVLLKTKDTNQIHFNQLNVPFLCGSECWFKIYKRSFIQKHRLEFTEGSNWEDLIFYAKAFISADSVSVINVPLYYYRKGHSSITSSNRHWRDVITNWRTVLSLLSPELSSVVRDSILVNNISSLLFWYGNFSKNDKVVAKEFYKELRTIFLSLNNLYNIRGIKPYIDYTMFKRICKNSWEKEQILHLMYNIFSICNSSDKKHKVVTILGVKLKISKLFGVCNTSSHRVFKFLGISLKLKKRLVGEKYYKTKIVNNRIVFDNFNGNGYGCNPKYIAEEIIRQKLPYELIWLVKNVETAQKVFPKQIKLVAINSDDAMKAMSSAKCLVFNCRRNGAINNGWQKKPEQCYIQTWHGAVAFKKIEKDIENNSVYTKYLNAAKIDSSFINQLISPSKKDTEILKNCFFYDGSILESGYPRNDIFFYSDEKKQNIIKNVKAKYNISDNKKIVIYVPTFRDSKDINLYKLDSVKICSALKNRFGLDWVFLVRLHPNIAYKEDELSKLFPNAINVTCYADIQELLLSSDIFISDYTSSIWDFVLQKKPAFIYAPDVEAYTSERDFYIPLDQMPFSLAKDEGALIQNIMNFKENAYKKNLDEFQKFRGVFDDGKASERVVKIIKEYEEVY